MKKTESIVSVRITDIKIIIVGLFVFIALTNKANSETVSFEGNIPGDSSITLTGILMKPDGDGPFSAVILLHGCDGIYSELGGTAYNKWASRLVNWGYVTLQVDSLGPRGEVDICGKGMRVAPFERMYDAYAGKSYLAQKPYVDKEKIAIMGWSHGAWTTLFAVNKNTLKLIKADPYKAAIAFYPWCGASAIHLTTPLLILMGEKDDWTPPDRCKKLKLEPETASQVKLRIYPNAYHGFDFEGIDTKLEGHQIKYDPAATSDAIVEVKNFLEKYLQ